jgi:hypothetical protein
MIGTAQSALVRDSVLEIDPSVQAAIAYQTKRATPVLIQDHILAEHADLAYRILEKLGKGRDRYPVSAHEFTAWSARANSREALVHFGGNHSILDMLSFGALLQSSAKICASPWALATFSIQPSGI